MTPKRLKRSLQDERQKRWSALQVDGMEFQCSILNCQLPNSRSANDTNARR